MGVLSDYSFRDLYEQVIFVRNEKMVRGIKTLFDRDNYRAPESTDACLCFCYLDAELGISFHFLCFADFDKEIIDMDSYRNQIANNTVSLFRYEPDFEVKEY